MSKDVDKVGNRQHACTSNNDNVGLKMQCIYMTLYMCIPIIEFVIHTTPWVFYTYLRSGPLVNNIHQ